MDLLAGLPEDVRKLALDRFRIIQPHLKGAGRFAAGFAEPVAHPDGTNSRNQLLQQVTKAVVEAARESLVIGQA